MTTINSVEDLVRVLDENPEWLEALRARILTRELLELPQKFAQFVETVNAFIESTNAFIESTNAFIESTNAILAETNRRINIIDTKVGELRGLLIRHDVLANAELITNDLGYRWVRSLGRKNLYEMIDGSGIPDIPSNERRSFSRADLVMETIDRDGQPCYIAVEISFTVDERDTSRAVRNAEFLTRFTGTRAIAAVAGMNRDNRIRDITGYGGDVYWFQLDPEILDPE